MLLFLLSQLGIVLQQLYIVLQAASVILGLLWQYARGYVFAAALVVALCLLLPGQLTSMVLALYIAVLYARVKNLTERVGELEEEHEALAAVPTVHLHFYPAPQRSAYDGLRALEAAIRPLPRMIA